MNILFDSDEERPRRFTMTKECAYCGDPCDKEFCCEQHENLFYTEDELSRDEEVYPEDDEAELVLEEERRSK